MKVILQETLEGVGNLGDLLDVSPGFARNYLLPRRKAVEANNRNIKAFEHAQRVTTEIQHDLSPAFLSPTRLVGLIGEARHRRSYVYDLPAMTRTRLFHNNTVRTIAPEYEWAPRCCSKNSRRFCGSRRSRECFQKMTLTLRGLGLFEQWR